MRSSSARTVNGWTWSRASEDTTNPPARAPRAQRPMLSLARTSTQPRRRKRDAAGPRLASPLSPMRIPAPLAASLLTVLLGSAPLRASSPATGAAAAAATACRNRRAAAADGTAGALAAGPDPHRHQLRPRRRDRDRQAGQSRPRPEARRILALRGQQASEDRTVLRGQDRRRHTDRTRGRRRRSAASRTRSAKRRGPTCGCSCCCSTTTTSRRGQRHGGPQADHRLHPESAGARWTWSR